MCRGIAIILPPNSSPWFEYFTQLNGGQSRRRRQKFMRNERHTARGGRFGYTCRIWPRNSTSRAWCFCCPDPNIGVKFSASMPWNFRDFVCSRRLQTPPLYHYYLSTCRVRKNDYTRISLLPRYLQNDAFNERQQCKFKYKSFANLYIFFMEWLNYNVTGSNQSSYISYHSHNESGTDILLNIL